MRYTGGPSKFLDMPFFLLFQIVKQNRLKTDEPQGRMEVVKIKPEYREENSLLLPAPFFISLDTAKNLDKFPFLDIKSEHIGPQKYENSRDFFKDLFGRSLQITDYSVEGIPFRAL